MALLEKHMKAEVRRVESLYNKTASEIAAYRKQVREAVVDVEKRTSSAFEADCKSFWKSVRKELQSHLSQASLTGSLGEEEEEDKVGHFEYQNILKKFERYETRVNHLEGDVERLKALGGQYQPLYN